MCIVGYQFFKMWKILNSCSNFTFDGFLTVMFDGIVMDLENLLELSPSQQTTLFGDITFQ